MQRIVVFLPNRGFFGSTLCTVPLLLRLRARHPGARVLALSAAPEHAILQRWGLVDEFHRYPRPPRPGLVLPFQRSRRGRAALVVNLRPGAEWVQLWSLLIPADERWSFDQSLGRLIDPRGVRYDIARYRAFAYLALMPGDPGPVPGDILAGWMAGGTAPPGRLVLIPSGVGADKQWPMERYEAVLRWWHGRRGGVTVIAGPREPHLAAWFTERGLAALPGVELLSGAGLPAEVAAMRAAAAVVQNDCGPGHIAQMVDAPRVVLFPAWADPAEWFRPGPRARHFRAPPGGTVSDVPTDAVLEALAAVA